MTLQMGGHIVHVQSFALNCNQLQTDLLVSYRDFSQLVWLTYKFIMLLNTVSDPRHVIMMGDYLSDDQNSRRNQWSLLSRCRQFTSAERKLCTDHPRQLRCSIAYSSRRRWSKRSLSAVTLTPAAIILRLATFYASAAAVIRVDISQMKRCRQGPRWTVTLLPSQPQPR